MTPDLPAELKVALERKAEGLSRNDAARRARLISERYRGGGDSKTIATENDALAYALGRMPATYAAIANCLGAIVDADSDFAPTSLLDIGAGPGTASWTAAQAFSSLHEFTLFDFNSAMRNLALDLARSDSRLSGLDYRQGDALQQIANAPSADLVIGSYFIGEFADTKRAALADAMWSKTLDMLLIVEPGTPAGYARIMELRARLIAQGAHVVAPCPHDNACPLVTPDWCHFTQRLARSRAHKQLKGAELPYEDEKFSYVALSREPVTPRPSRLLTQPKISKVAVTMKLCTANGIDIADIPHRDKANYSIARKLNWGDAVSEKNPAPE
jgi:ribosomal protein RSM22 (predicted rRNA methylase)